MPGGTTVARVGEYSIPIHTTGHDIFSVDIEYKNSNHHDNNYSTLVRCDLFKTIIILGGSNLFLPMS